VCKLVRKKSFLRSRIVANARADDARSECVLDSPEGRLAGARLSVGTARATRRAHVALGREAVARGVHLLAKIGL
jgi:hypothetical protein